MKNRNTSRDQSHSSETNMHPLDPSSNNPEVQDKDNVIIFQDESGNDHGEIGLYGSQFEPAADRLVDLHPECEENEIIIQYDKVASLIDSFFKSEPYIEYEKLSSEFTESKRKFHDCVSLVRKGAIEYQLFLEEYNGILGRISWLGKEFDFIRLFQNPSENEISKDWFESIARALVLIEKSGQEEVDDKLGRIPPKNFRACLKLVSKQEMVATLPTLTPIYTLKNPLDSEVMTTSVRNSIKTFYNNAKWLLSSERKITSELVKSLKAESDYSIENINESEIVSKMRVIQSRLQAYGSSEEEKKEAFATFDKDEFDAVVNAQNLLTGEIHNLYQKNEELKVFSEGLKKSFLKSALADIYRLSNELDKVGEKFDKETTSLTEDINKDYWQSQLIELKSSVIKFLSKLDIYENPRVVKEETIWDDTMDYLEPIEAVDDAEKPLGLVCEVRSTGFYYQSGDEKEYIERTKVILYRNN